MFKCTAESCCTASSRSWQLPQNNVDRYNSPDWFKRPNNQKKRMCRNFRTAISWNNGKEVITEAQTYNCNKLGMTTALGMNIFVKLHVPKHNQHASVSNIIIQYQHQITVASSLFYSVITSVTQNLHSIATFELSQVTAWYGPVAAPQQWKDQ
jgi:hypothetical protein